MEDPSETAELSRGNSSHRTSIAVLEQLPRDTGVVKGRLETQPRSDELVALASLKDDVDWARTLFARISACMVMQGELLAGDSQPNSQLHTWLSRSCRSLVEMPVSPLGSPGRQPAAFKNGGTKKGSQKGTDGTTRASLLLSNSLAAPTAPIAAIRGNHIPNWPREGLREGTNTRNTSL